MNEECILAIESHLYAIVDGKVSKPYKNMADGRYSLTIVQSGTAANASGTFLFIGSGKNMKSCALSEAKLVSTHSDPTVSKFGLNDNGYMKDVDYKEDM